MVISSVSAQPESGFEAPFGVSIVPSSVVTKVGERSRINVTITNPESVSGSQVCFSAEGFPATGFITTFAPLCSSSQGGRFGTVLTVEVTPAAAPQTVEAHVIARDNNQTAQAVLNITTEPAIPPWIPWAGLLLFVSVLVAVVVLKPKFPIKRGGSRGEK